MKCMGLLKNESLEKYIERGIKEKKSLGWNHFSSIWYIGIKRSRSVDCSFSISNHLGFDGNMLET